MVSVKSLEYHIIKLTLCTIMTLQNSGKRGKKCHFCFLKLMSRKIESCWANELWNWNIKPYASGLSILFAFHQWWPFLNNWSLWLSPKQTPFLRRSNFQSPKHPPILSYHRLPFRRKHAWVSRLCHSPSLRFNCLSGKWGWSFIPCPPHGIVESSNERSAMKSCYSLLKVHQR